MLANPAVGDLDIQLDFKENVTVPLGPGHAQDWFWATARRSITTLGFCVTHLSAERKVVTRYFHYLTYILDHSQLFAALALKDLLRRLGLPGAPFQKLHVWADCGTHFRGYLFLWELRSVCLEFGLAEAVLHLYAEHHGKGRCDGQFGLQRRWTDEWAEKHVIKNLEDLIQACRAGAQAAMRSDAPPVGPSYEIVRFNPAKPSEAFGLDEKAADFMIEYTYCIAVRKDPTQEWGVQVHNYVYSDRMLQRGQGPGTRLAPIRRRAWPTGDPGWRLSYRKTEPESEPLNLRALQRRLEKQAAYATGPTARRDAVVEKVRKLEAQAARSLAKAGRQRKQAASLLGSSSSSASSDASSSSS